MKKKLKIKESDEIKWLSDKEIMEKFYERNIIDNKYEWERLKLYFLIGFVDFISRIYNDKGQIEPEPTAELTKMGKDYYDGILVPLDKYCKRRNK